MSEKIELSSGQQIQDWSEKNGFGVIVNADPDAPRFFQGRAPVTPGPIQLYSVEHSFMNTDVQPMVTVKRIFRASSAEDALYQYYREPKERSAGNREDRVGFALNSKPGSWANEAILVAKLINQ